MNTEYIKKVMKAALPHQSQFIDEQDPSSYYYLLDEIEGKLLEELQKILDGKEVTQSSIQQARDISKAVVDAQAKGGGQS
jgi:hypothetical protein